MFPNEWPRLVKRGDTIELKIVSIKNIKAYCIAINQIRWKHPQTVTIQVCLNQHSWGGGGIKAIFYIEINRENISKYSSHNLSKMNSVDSSVFES